MKENKLFKKADIIIIVSIFILFAGFFAFKSVNTENLSAKVFVNNKLVNEIVLSDVKNDYDLPLNDEYNIVLHVAKNSIEFKSSDCKDHVCVKTGKLAEFGDVAVCAPAKVMIIIEGREKNNFQTY